MMRITVIVPTYRRPEDLKRCLEALEQQTRPADEIILAVRDADAETWSFLAKEDWSCLVLHVVAVTVTGVVAAMNTALNKAGGDIIAFTDDDAAPHVDWLERIEGHFLADERVGGVGGRDILKRSKLEHTSKKIVGKLQWFGRVIGNHHSGTGQPREVDVLKGVNMSFRRTAIANLHFDERLRGTGAQVYFEIKFCLTLRKLNWKLIYDPEIVVDHYTAQRFDEDQRNNKKLIAVVNAVHNDTLILLEHLPPVQRIIFFVWVILVGTRCSWGLLQWLRFCPSRGFLYSTKRYVACLQGRWYGYQTWRESCLKKQLFAGNL